MKLTLAEAKKQVRAEKPRENYMVLRIDGRYVLPYKDGILLLQALANVEQLHSWDDSKPIFPIEEESIKSFVMSYKEYEQRKMAALMGVSLRDIKAAEEAAESTP